MIASELAASLKNKQKTPANIAELIRNKTGNHPNFCWFLGAGASRSSGISTAGELVEKWRREAFNELCPSPEDRDSKYMKEWLLKNEGSWYDEQSEYGCFMERKFSVPRQRRQFIELEVNDKVPSIGYAYLVRLAEKHFVRTSFTTNFDDLINEAFYQFSSTRPVVCAHDSSIEGIPINSERPKIIKLHGDYLFDKLQTTSNETTALGPNMDLKLREFAKEYGLIMIGYGGCDRSVMHPIEDMLKNATYLQNGIYWCFRKADEISRDVFNQLSKPNAFYAIIEGFDEFLAELYSILIGSDTPFNSKVASDRADKVIESYISSLTLQTCNSKVISAHLARLKAERDSTQIAQTLQDLQRDGYETTRSQIADSDLLKLLEIEKCARSRDISEAIRLAQAFRDLAENKEFQQILLQKLFYYCILLDKKEQALIAADKSLEIEPDNYYVILAKCQILDSRKERVDLLNFSIERNPFAHLLHHQLAQCR